jgi:abequosyltransferase
MMPAHSQSDSSHRRIKLSICIPTYNRAAYLGAAISSAIEQINRCANPQEVELVIYDNHSTDDTAAVVAQFARDFANLRYAERDVNVGCDRNIVEVGELSSGEYFWILGSDDTLPPGAVDIVIRTIDEMQPDLILGDANDCDVEMNKTGYLKFLKCDAREFHFDRTEDVTDFLQSASMTASLFGYLTSMVFKRSTWDQLPLARYTLGSAYVQVFRALDVVCHRNSKMAYIAQPIANNRRNNCNYQAEFGDVQRYLIDLRMFRIAIDEYFSRDLATRNLFKKFVRSCFGRMAQERIRTGIAVMDELLQFFEADDVVMPEIQHWALHPLIERASRRFEHNGIAQRCFSGDAILHIGYRHQGSALFKPINKQAIGVEHGYSGYNGVNLPFESASAGTIYLSNYVTGKNDIAPAILEWWRVLRDDGYLVVTNSCGPVAGQHEIVRASAILAQIETTLSANGYQIVHCEQSFPDPGNDSISEVDIVIKKRAATVSQSMTDSKKTISELLAQAIQLHADGNADQSMEVARRVLQLDASNTTALQLMGLIAYQKGAHIDAISHFTDALQHDSRLTDAYLNMGCAYVAIGGNAEAMQCFAAALALRPDSAAAQANLNIVRANIASHAAQRQGYLQLTVTHPQLAKAQQALASMLNRSAAA